MKSLKKMLAAGLAAATMVSVAACGNSSSSDAGTGSADNPVTIEVWGWEPLLTDVKEAFEKENPNIKVNITNVGTAGKQYTAMTNAFSAGSGAPDVAQVEYYALSQYVVSGNLKDLSEFGAKDYADFYTSGPWSSVNINDGVYGLPLDSGPMALFYNKEIFDKAGVTEPPTTMEEYYEAAKKIHALGSDYYITSDPGESAPEEMMMWVAGGTPFKTDGENITIDLTGDKGVQQFTEWWQKLVDEDLIDTKSGRWTDEWAKSLNNGKIASLTIGAWMVSMLDDNAPDGAGKWRVAETPVFDASKPYNAEDGGSTLAITANSKKAEAAWKFVDFAAHGDGVKIRVDKGQFPADKASLAASDFQDKTDPYFGDQKFNEVLAKAADSVYADWQFLPYEVYARNIYTDVFGKAARREIKFADAVSQWQDQLVAYGKNQGYKVNE